MIQRIQSIYLLAAASLIGLFAVNPLATFATADGVYLLQVSGIKSFDAEMILQTPYLMIIVALAALLPLVNIFLFKKRMLQIRLCVVQMVLAAGTLAIGGVYYHLSNRFFGADAAELLSSAPRIVCILPVLAIYLDYLALRGILKDEMLIKSLDRIR
ncbi:MAG: DUF4293 domain-containing protein [Rikenellaceae bacterium]